MRKKLILICFLFFVCFKTKAQDPTFSQYYNNPLYYNPAFTGINDGLNIYTNIRNQWPYLAGQFNTQSVSADLKNRCMKTGVGLLLMKDNEGEGSLKTLTAGASFTYCFEFLPHDKWILQTGAQVCYVQKTIDWSKLEFVDQFDEVKGLVRPTSNVSPVSEKVTYPDFNLGFVTKYNTRQQKATWMLDAGVSHVTTPNQTMYNIESRLPMKVAAQVAFSFQVRQPNTERYKIYLVPHAQFQYQSVFKTYEVGIRGIGTYLNGTGSKLNLGVSYRRFNNSDGLIFNLNLHRNFSKDAGVEYTIGYSYDVTVSKLSVASTRGSHEIALIISIPKANAICRLCGYENGNGKNKKNSGCPVF